MQVGSVLFVGYCGVFGEFSAGKTFTPAAVSELFVVDATIVYRTDILPGIGEPMHLTLDFCATRALRRIKAALDADDAAGRGLNKVVHPEPPFKFLRVGIWRIYKICDGAQ